MWFELWEEISGIVAFVVAGMAIAAVLYAVILRSATNHVTGLELPFGQAYATTLIIWFMLAVAQVIIGGVAAVNSRQTGDLIVMVLAAPTSLLVQAWVIKWRVYVKFGKALRISLRVLIIVAVLVTLGVLGYRVLT